jgi:hypothetical protein
MVASPKNDGVAATIKQTPGTLGYIEYGFAKIAKLPMAWLENMLAGYTFIDKAVADGVDLFTLRHATALLELNHIVLCGINQEVRQEYHTHIEVTTQRFHEQEECNIDDILRWYYRHEGESSWKRAAGV